MSDVCDPIDNRRLAIVVALGLAPCVAGCGSDTGVAGVPVMPLVEETLVASKMPLAGTISPEADGFGFARARDLRFSGDRLVVLENQNSRLVIFDRDLRPVQTIGREGAGPGELRGAFSIDVLPDQYAVAEINNVRITVFSPDGSFLRSFAVPAGMEQFAYGPDGTIYVNAYDGRHYMYAVNGESISTPFAERPRDLYLEAGLGETPASLGHVLVAVTRSGDVHLYDPLIAGLIRFDAAGTRTFMRSLPPRFREGLRTQTQLVAADFGGSGKGWGARATDLTVTDDDRLLLLFPPIDGVFGLIMDPETYAAQAVRWSPEVLAARPGLGGASGVIRQGRFWHVVGDEVTVYTLQPDGS